MDSAHSILLTTLALFLYFLVDYLRAGFRSDLRQLPGPLSARFSSLYRLRMVWSGDAPESYRNVHKRYGPYVRVGPNHVSISDPSMIPVIYGISSTFLKGDFYKPFSAAPYKGVTLEGLFDTRNPSYHKALKQPVAQLYSMTNMRNYEKFADECTAIFIDAMRELEGKPVDLGQWVQWYAFDVVAYISFSRKLGFLETRADVGNLIGGIEKGLEYIKYVSQFPNWHVLLLGNHTLMKFVGRFFPSNGPKTLEQLLSMIEDMIQLFDEKRINSGQSQERTDFLSQLKAKDVKSGLLNNTIIMSHLLNNLAAGSDTTAITLRAAFYYSMKTPGVLEKLEAEIALADQKGQLSEFITFDECLKLPYLQAVLKEAMRLHPGVAFPLERVVPREGLRLGNTHLGAGTIVGMSAPVLHMDKNVFGVDAESFRPERWIDASTEQLKLMDRNFFTFGYGARTCIGKNISIMEMGKFFPQIIRHFKLRWASSDPEWKTDAAWFWKQTGVVVAFESRKYT